ncbi:hypothetical protein Q5Y75_05870 [Ruegeria sp. 2205SS24-7]|uniref:hypothetical protein n=1 Tax=Ruegeria discodermiae TaxID=3064389 RepID=UPI002741010D|nr:hypothetical protein [Ruegeria sp. 2205SS24-7]MDP5216739.1 hypothetical protein [Ruegeria sp. 2205SS24-7]
MTDYDELFRELRKLEFDTTELGQTGPAAKAAQAIEDLRAEVQRCHERLEITHVWRVEFDAEPDDGEDYSLIKTEIPYDERATTTDGIECRDCTIQLLEEDIANLRADRAKLREALTEIATGRNAKGEKSDFPEEIARAALSPSEDG